MKKILLSLFACCLAAPVLADEAPWITSLPDALTQAKNQNKLVLLDFTGSDWCGWCKKLDAEMFSKPEFINYAANNLVLVQLDYPHQKPQSADLREVNKALADKYDITGYPTLIVLNGDGYELWKKVGYMEGGPAAMIAKLNELKPKGSAPSASALPPGWKPGAPPAPKPGGEPRLQGIFYSRSHPTALLNGKICSEGDSVEGMRVLKIAPDKATVEWHGKTNELTIQ